MVRYDSKMIPTKDVNVVNNLQSDEGREEEHNTQLYPWSDTLEHSIC